MENQEYDKAYGLFSSLDNYKDSDMLKNHCYIMGVIDACVGYVEQNDIKSAKEQLMILEDTLVDGTYDTEIDRIISAGRTIDNTYIAKRAFSLISNHDTVDPDNIIFINYTKLMDLIIKDAATISEADELLKTIPDNYEDIEHFKLLYNFYKGYVGTYRDKVRNISCRMYFMNGYFYFVDIKIDYTSLVLSLPDDWVVSLINTSHITVSVSGYVTDYYK